MLVELRSERDQLVESIVVGHPKYGFVLATGFAGLLFVGLLLNWMFVPTRELLSQLDKTEYR